MGVPIHLRRGRDSSRKKIIPRMGEPVWTTDKKELYVGDGETKGGTLAIGRLEVVESKWDLYYLPDDVRYVYVQDRDRFYSRAVGSYYFRTVKNTRVILVLMDSLLNLHAESNT